jgi:hypothetical protein
MSWPKRFYSCAWPDVEAADAWELTGPGRPVARDPRGYASAVCPIWLSAWSWATPHAIRLANTAVNQILAAGPLASDRQLLLRDYVADSPNRTVARTSPRLVV